MKEEYIDYELAIKRKHSINWTPKFEEKFRTDLKKEIFIPVVLKALEKLEWDVVYRDVNSVEAKRKDKWDKWSEKITVTFDFGEVKIKSISLGNAMWDKGHNSKRVLLLKYVIEQTEKEFDKEALIKLQKDSEHEDKWNDYIIPESLPQPKEYKEPQFWVLTVGGILAALIIGYFIALLTIDFIYMIGVFEIGVGIAMAYILKRLIKFSNYTFFNNLHYLFIGMIVITFTSNQIFQYQIILSENEFTTFSFFEFMQERFKAGLRVKSMNTGWIGLLISWVLQFVITYYVGLLRMIPGLAEYQISRVPTEVIEFAFYNFVKEKTEEQVREELSKKGWKSKRNQDEVFEAIGASHEVNEMNRME